ncbi:MAG TPA: helicase C-terminal domain-containing protein, partial [Candidatus Bathyarchaeia archaeon]|nr:helicase C-terminal domain-containing protein [Candidatus Bathyarchaeia archaeon]
SINHALLLKWPERYGSIQRLIIDEAHELAGEGDRAFCEEIGSRELRSLLGQIAGGGSGGLALALGNRAGDPALARRAVDLAARVERMLPAIGDALFGAAPNGSTVVPAGDVEVLPEPWRAPARLLGSLAAELATLGEMLDHLNGMHRATLFADQGRAGDPLSASAGAVALALASAARGLIADAFVQSRTATVYAAQAFDRREAGHEWRLSATPLEVADLIHARLLEPARTVVAVSATLGISGDPRPSLEKIGWQRVPAARRLPPRVIPSPFDFPHQSVLAFVRGQQYRQPGFAARCATAIVEIARLLGGRTMALFTNRQRLGDVVARIAEHLAADGIAVLAQERPGGAARLVEQFNADPRCVLLGLRSLWQGVDIPGEALSCVVIEKLPFPRPDPLLVGRSRRIREAGGDDFRALSLEPAVVAFKQMFGRLIRNESDRGFVVVIGADTTMRYLPEFVASLPGPPRLVVGELEEILTEMRAFFAPRAP